MFNICTYCFDQKVEIKDPYEYLCVRCLNTLVPSKKSAGRGDAKHPITFEKPTILSLYSYEGTIRDLILRAKVKCDLRALQSLRKLFLSHPHTNKSCLWATHIMPAPSSFWGRVRGRYDVPGHISFYASKRHSIPALSPPLALLWRGRKQAFKNNTSSAKPTFKQLETKHTKNATAKAPTTSHTRNNSPASLSFLGGRKILVIDDIATSGATCARIQASLPGDDVRFLTLACSR